MHRSQIFQLALLAFLGGVALASFISVPLALVWCGVGIGGLCLAVPRQRFLLAGIIIFSVIGGVMRMQNALAVPAPLWDLAADRPTATLIGYVMGDATPTKTGLQYPFHVVRVDGDSGSQSIADGVMVFGPDTMRPRYGQVLALTGKIQQPKNSGDFDYISYLAKSGIHATLYFPTYSVPLDWQPSVVLRTRLALIGTLHHLRDALVASLAHAVAQPEAAYLAGLLVGAQGIVSADIKDMFARTGTSHILAISGYNITIVAGVLAGLMSPLGRRRAFGASIGGIIAFTLMVGASASVVRAAVMAIMALSARFLGRLTDAGIAILLSASVMVVLNPLILRWDVGFQLSFLAFIGIVYVEPLIAPLLTRLLRWPLLAQAAATTLAASLTVLPLLLFQFGQLAVYTLPTNLIVLPLVPVAMALGFASATAGLLVPFLGQLIGQSAWLVAAFQLGVVRFFAGLPSAALEVTMSPAVLVACYGGLAAWLILEYRKKSYDIRTNIRHPETRYHSALVGGRDREPIGTDRFEAGRHQDGKRDRGATHEPLR